MKTKFTEDIKSNVKSLIDANKNSLQETKDAITRIVENTSAYEIIIKDIWDEIQDIVPTTSENTWYLVGEQLNEFIKTTVERTKNSLAIIVPDITEVPIDPIKKLDQAVQVLIITKTELEESEILEEQKSILHELYKLGNVRVRKGKGISYRLLWRDNEEVLIAPGDTKTLGFISEDPSYIAMIEKLLQPEIVDRSAEVPL